jgi:hypothetical protein
MVDYMSDITCCRDSEFFPDATPRNYAAEQAEDRARMQYAEEFE